MSVIEWIGNSGFIQYWELGCLRSYSTVGWTAASRVVLVLEATRRFPVCNLLNLRIEPEEQSM